jgi:hypothetical protein
VPAAVLGGVGPRHRRRLDRKGAVQLLQDASDLPLRLAAEFSRRWAALTRTIDLPAPATGYSSVVPGVQLTPRSRPAHGPGKRLWLSARRLVRGDLPPCRRSRPNSDVVSDAIDAIVLFRPYVFASLTCVPSIQKPVPRSRLRRFHIALRHVESGPRVDASLLPDRLQPGGVLLLDVLNTSALVDVDRFAAERCSGSRASG